MAYATINKPSDYFNTVLYTGDGTAIGSGGQSITGVGFQPDWVWTKARSQSHSHTLYDSSRGVQKPLVTNSTATESTETEGLDSFDSDGFTTGNKDNSGQSGTTYASWHWKANGGTTSSNTDGSITSTVQANTTAGFSVITWTGSGSAGTVGHGLGKQVDMVFLKCRTATQDWRVYSRASMGTSTGDSLYLNLNLAQGSNSNNINSGSSTTFGLSSGNLSINATSNTYVAYCFAEIEGYSKFGSYTGNGSSDGTFVYTGFKPAFIIIKGTNVAQGWWTFDNKRVGYNVDNNLFQAENSASENTSDWIDILSNGFKPRSSDNGLNGSYNYIYMAFAENPLVGTNGIPATAR